MNPLHVLVVSENAERLHALAQPFREDGMTVLAEANAATAMSALNDPSFDALVLDLALPQLDRAGLRRAVTPDQPAAPDSLEMAERRHIAAALEYSRGNRRQAALLLGIARSTLLHKLRKYGLA